jgi:hypothetical protein
VKAKVWSDIAEMQDSMFMEYIQFQDFPHRTSPGENRHISKTERQGKRGQE